MPGLEDLYREIILDHYRNPRNRGELDSPPAHMAEGFNPLCGDEVKVYLLVDDGKISDIRIGGQGCSISQSSPWFRMSVPAPGTRRSWTVGMAWPARSRARPRTRRCPAT